MNNITDITILIAVIALTMWPVVLLVLKTMNIRKKRLEHLERTLDLHPRITDKIERINL